MTRGVLTATAWLCIAGWCVPAGAHPHGWIDLQSTVIFDGDGRIAALQLDWLFDEFYSAFVLADIAANGQPRDETLRQMAGQDIENLREYGYFSDVRVDDVRVDTATVEEFDAGLRDDRLWLRFTVPLQQPVDPRSHAVKFAIYDPTYFIAILHVEDAPVVLTGTGAEGCHSRIIQPTPSLDAIGLAAALDRTQTSDDTLGEVFAEWVRVRCD